MTDDGRDRARTRQWGPDPPRVRALRGVPGACTPCAGQKQAASRKALSETDAGPRALGPAPCL